MYEIHRTLVGKGETIIMALDDLKAADQLITDIGTTVADGQAASTALHQALDAANGKVAELAAGDVVTAAQIADLQAQLAAATSAATTITTSLQTADAAVQAADAGLKG